MTPPTPGLASAMFPLIVELLMLRIELPVVLMPAPLFDWLLLITELLIDTEVITPFGST